MRGHGIYLTIFSFASLSAVHRVVVLPVEWIERSRAQALQGELVCLVEQDGNVRTFFDQLHCALPCVKAIKIQRKLDGLRVVSCEVERPWLKIVRNAAISGVLTRSGSVVPPTVLDEDSYAGAPEVCLAHQDPALDDYAKIAAWAQNLPELFWAFFDVIWFDEHCIECRYKQEPWLVVRVTESFDWSDYGEKLSSWAKALAAGHDEPYVPTILDTRFEGNIILSRAAGSGGKKK